VSHRSNTLLALLAVGALGTSACSGAADQHSKSRARNHPNGVADLRSAERPRSDQFPSVDGRSLKQLASLASSTAQLGAATGTFTPGTRRFAFGLTGSTERFIYAPTAIYLASTPGSLAQGPFLAPADPMVVAPQYRSKQDAGPADLRAIYWTELPLRRPGVFDLLALSRAGRRLTGATGEVVVARSSTIPDVGQRPPPVATDTLASVHGNVSLLTTRRPPEQMHSVSFNQVLGKRPIALLFSTPQLCTSRVCGPVTDLAVELAHRLGGPVVFIHQEVYVDNQPSKGLRPQLRAFHLHSEPWLFAVNRRGVIVARLEGAFGVLELQQALHAALG
jgi:hypothetical protein